jgi:hypothetical protein
MNNPTEYILVSEGSPIEDCSRFSNLEWGKDTARKQAEATRLAQTIYQLVPVYQVDVKVTYEFPITEAKLDRI